MAEPDSALRSGCLLWAAKFPAPPAPPSNLQASLVSAWTHFWPSFLLGMGIATRLWRLGDVRGKKASVQGETGGLWRKYAGEGAASSHF